MNLLVRIKQKALAPYGFYNPLWKNNYLAQEFYAFLSPQHKDTGDSFRTFKPYQISHLPPTTNFTESRGISPSYITDMPPQMTVKETELRKLFQIIS